MRIEIKIILQNLQITVFAIQTFADTLKREDKGRTLLKRIVPVVDGIVIIGIINNEYGLPVIRNKFDIDPLVQRQLIVIAEIVDLAAEAESAVGADIKDGYVAIKGWTEVPLPKLSTRTSTETRYGKPTAFVPSGTLPSSESGT